MANEILEPFSPTLSGECHERFNLLIENLAEAYPNYTSGVVSRELKNFVR